MFYLNNPLEGYILPKVWKKMYVFSKRSGLFCLSSREFEQEEYIWDYSEFLAVIEAKCR